MKRINLLLIYSLACLFFFAADAQAQMMRYQIVSPEVHKDRTVTFRYNAPEATKAELSAQFLKENLPMTKDENGIWSVTTPPVAPDLYPYNFIIDQVTVNDPNNVLIFPNEKFKGSLVDVQGDTPPTYAVLDVPHGKISYRFYTSKTLNDTRPLVVYTPPGYDPNDKSKTYPVLYLIHGATDTHETWFKVGRVNFILDNLIAQGKAEPMIIVIPYANPRMTYAGKNIEGNPVDFTDELIKEVIPYTEKNYRVRTDADSRAIAGFSRGGSQTLNAGLGHPELFHYICPMAPAVNAQRVDESFKNGTYASVDVLKSNLKLLWLGCGTEDFLYEGAVGFAAKMDELGVPYEKKYTPGGHTWMNCRIYLYEIAQKLFK
ncbi:enterochelin esterase-like enzyme [Parabacteroides sp. PFB2-12]|uniref:esterase n=1 Tax=unclassified Parabacteroides TaxID=2649774 RepID=UPI0024767A4E|nr:MULTISPECIES: esterase [unclassified Parabacteroides]MDH6343117.1 enterochelin esterase-like enzyme [Parabacteroides sp. PM6-13]MDH6390761.1 enterochelin esterase-like enzyme [Parabacteroides sp. PFB2-12]